MKTVIKYDHIICILISFYLNILIYNWKYIILLEFSTIFHTRVYQKILVTTARIDTDLVEDPKC